MPAGGLWVRLLHLRGISVYVDPILILLVGFLIVAGDIGTSTGVRLVAAALLLGSVFLHELGHAWMARHRGLHVSGIFLHLLPFAYVQRGKPRDEVRVSLAGPGASLLIAAASGALLFARGDIPAFELSLWMPDILAVVFAINLLMGTVNLIPALPLDGGRAVRAALQTRMEPMRVYQVAAWVGTVTGIVVACAGIWIGTMPGGAIVTVLGVYLVVAAWRERPSD